MTLRALALSVAAALLTAGCAEEDGGLASGVDPSGYPEATWTISAEGVSCANGAHRADREDPETGEPVVYCTWFCHAYARPAEEPVTLHYVGGPPMTVGATFRFTDGEWRIDPARTYIWIPMCW